MKLRYKAISNAGKIIRGNIESKDPSEAALYLRERNLTPVDIVPQAQKDWSMLLGKKKVKSKDVVLFTRQLSSMLTSGLTLIKSLEILKDQTPNKVIEETLGAVLLDLQEG